MLIVFSHDETIDRSSIHFFLFVHHAFLFDSILGKVARGVQARTMATEAQLKVRIMGTQNISKIAKSMKMVSAAKLRGDQTRLAAAIPFAVRLLLFFMCIHTLYECMTSPQYL